MFSAYTLIVFIPFATCLFYAFLCINRIDKFKRFDANGVYGSTDGNFFKNTLYSLYSHYTFGLQIPEFIKIFGILILLSIIIFLMCNYFFKLKNGILEKSDKISLFIIISIITSATFIFLNFLRNFLFPEGRIIIFYVPIAMYIIYIFFEKIFLRYKKPTLILVAFTTLLLISVNVRLLNKPFVSTWELFADTKLIFNYIVENKLENEKIYDELDFSYYSRLNNIGLNIAEEKEAKIFCLTNVSYKKLKDKGHFKIIKFFPVSGAYLLQKE